MNIEEIAQKIVKAIKNQVSTVELLIGKQKWEIVNGGGDELFGVSTQYLSEDQLEKLEQAGIDGIFDKDTIYNGEHFHLDAFVDVHYWIGVYTNFESPLETQGNELKDQVVNIIGYPVVSQ